MLTKLSTFVLVGIDVVPVEFELYVSAGLPKAAPVGAKGFRLVGQCFEI
jgi:hypothetical protein